MSKKIRVNGREYNWPIRPTVVVCVDGCEPDYIEQAVNAGAMSFTAERLKRGADLRADGVVPQLYQPE